MSGASRRSSGSCPGSCPGRRGSLAVVFLVLATGCATERVDESWSYTVTLTTTDPPRVSVEARFVGEDPAFRAFATPDRQGMPYIEGLRLDTGSQLIPTDDAAGPTTFALAEPSRQAILRYSFDLDDLAADVRDLKVASHAGSAVFAAWTAWLLIPDGDRDAEVDLTFVSTTPDGSIAVAIDDAERGTVRVRSSALRERIYAVFGDLEVGRREVHRQGQGGPAPARLTVVSPRRAFTLSGADHAGWVHENAELIGAFAGAFPVDATLIVLIPIPGDGGPVFGRVQPSIAPTLLAFVGASSATSALEEDWILVHELLHLTFPPVSQRDRWIDEGIATYFEPVLRARGPDLRGRDVGRIREGAAARLARARRSRPRERPRHR